MKCSVLFLLLFMTLGLNAAKVALIPTAPELAPVADQVLAAMSDVPGIEFLERASIEVALKERKLTAAGLTGVNFADLSKIIHADLFAVITAKPALAEKKYAAVSGLIIYDARNGFRLVNATLSEQDTVKDIVERLRRSYEIIKHPEKQILLSMATVRDAGVPERFKYMEAFIAADLERRLGGIPNVIMLERDYLDSVNQERKLTGQMFALAPSARLLRLEFSPGSSSEIVNMTLRITDAASKELFHFSLDNCIGDTKNTGERTISVIAEYLKVSQPTITASATDEAARFFAEYQFLNRVTDYEAARRKLDSAIALDPNKLEYRLEMLKLNMLDSQKSRIAAMLWKNLQICQEIERDFPAKNDLGLYDSPSCFKWPERNQLTTEEMTALAEFGNAFRPKYDAQTRKLLDNYNPNASFYSYNYLNRSCTYCHQLSKFDLYYDFDKWGKNLSYMALRNLKQSMDYFREHPSDIPVSRSSSYAITFDYLPVLEETFYSFWNNRQIDRTTAVEKLIRNSGEYIELALQHPIPQLKFSALRLELWKKTIESNYDETAFKNNMLDYCRKSAAIDRELFNQSALSGGFSQFLGPSFASGPYHAQLLFLAQQIKQKFSHSGKQLSPSEAVFASIRQITDHKVMAKKTIELAPQVLEYQKKAATNREILINLNDLSKNLSIAATNEREPQTSTLIRTAITALTPDVEITKLFTLDKSNYQSNPGSALCPENGNNNDLLRPYRIVNTIYQDGSLYLLLLGINENHFTAIARFNMTDQTLNMVSLRDGPINVHWSNGRRRQFTVSGNLAAVAGDDRIYLFPMDGRPAREIKDLPAKNVMAVTIMNERIYAFVGREGPGYSVALETVLFSCNFDGGDRRIHISTLREDKHTGFDQLPPFIVYQLIADPAKNRLLFVCGTGSGLENKIGINGFTEFFPNTGLGACLLNYNYFDNDINVLNNDIYLEYMQYAARYHIIYNIKTEKMKPIIQVAATDADKHPIPAIVYGHYNNTASLFARSGQLWFCDNYLVKLITLPEVDKSPLIILPEYDNCHQIFPHPDGKSAIAVGERNIYKITPKKL